MLFFGRAESFCHRRRNGNVVRDAPATAAVCVRIPRSREKSWKTERRRKGKKKKNYTSIKIYNNIETQHVRRVLF